MNLPPSTPSTSRANSGMSRLAAMQAQFQAQQLAEKEKRLLNMMESRQEETVRRIAYGTNPRMDSAPHSATSLSSNNSSNSLTPSVGQRPIQVGGMGNLGYQGGRVRQYFDKQRAQQQDILGNPECNYYNGNGSSSGQSKGPSPMGWDKSFPLKPVQPEVLNADPGLPPETGRTSIYKRNISNASSVSGRNKYSGNYGLKSSQTAPKDYYKGRGYSLDRSRAASRYSSPTRRPVNGGMTRTRSQVQLGANGQNGTGGCSSGSGDDSYGSSSRPPSSGYRDWISGSTPMYSSRSQRDLISVSNRNNLVSNGYVTGSVRNSARSVGNMSRSNSRNNVNYNPAEWFGNVDTPDGYDDGTSRKTSYTREYVRNLPPTNLVSSVKSSAPPVTTRASKIARSSSSHGKLNSASVAQNSAGEYGEHCSSYSSSHSSSDKSDPPAFNVIPNSSATLANSNRGRIGAVISSGGKFSRNNSNLDIRDKNSPISSDEPYISEEKSKINSQTFRKSRSPTSKGRSVQINSLSSHRSASISPSRSPARRSYGGSSDDQVNNNNTAPVPGSNNAYNLQQQKTNMTTIKNKEKEEEKRRLQSEMRKREQELLNKIKEQQKMLESMKHEKSKVERELHRQEVLRDKERKTQEEQKREQDKEIEREKQRQHRQRIEAETASARRNKYSREALRAAAADAKKEICRTSSNSTSGSKGDIEPEETEDELENRNLFSSRKPQNGGLGGMAGGSRAQRRKSPPKHMNKTASAPNQYNTTAYISNGEDNAVNISIRSNGNAHDTDKGDKMRSSNQSKNIPFCRRNTPSVNGANSCKNPKGARKGPHHPSPSPSRKPFQPTRNSNIAQSSSSSPTKASNTQTKASPLKARQSIFAPKPRDDLVACSNCGRNFAVDRIEKHEDICLNTSKSKRKTFDMTKKRVQGTDAESFVLPKGKRGITAKGSNVGKTVVSSKREESSAKPDWRKKHEEFINALRAAKAVQRHISAGGKASDLPPPPPLDTSDYVQCPYCNRRFNEAAAERHIPKCNAIKCNKR